MPLPHNLFDYCSIRKSNFIEKYLVVKRKISFVYKADILLTKLIIRECDIYEDLLVAGIHFENVNLPYRLRNIQSSSSGMLGYGLSLI